MAVEVLQWLDPKPGGRYLDATLGYGGLAEKILQALGPDGVLLGIDRDPAAVGATQERLKKYPAKKFLLNENFSKMRQCLARTGLERIDGAVFDLGVSSPQLDDPTRGFSFRAEGPLDMRMNPTEGPTGADLINELEESELADLLWNFGEERYARRIARHLVQHRPVRTTQDLVKAVERAVPPHYRHGRIHCATRTFQALRIAVNAELDVIGPAIRDAIDLLTPPGRVCVISFHSLEDRIVKRTFQALAKSPSARVRILTKKPIVPSQQEVDANPRARSAKLRVAERLPREVPR
jgi:16S rRNA (cytosine1402-N4)-methyltransferase